MNEKLTLIFEQLEFNNWYESLSKMRSEQRLEDYSNNEVIELTKKMGFDVKYYKKENFFRYVNEFNGIQTNLNFSLKYGLVELILDLVINGERIRTGGPFTYIYRLLNNGEVIKNPSFKDYNELEFILNESFRFIEKLNLKLREEF